MLYRKNTTKGNPSTELRLRTLQEAKFVKVAVVLFFAFIASFFSCQASESETYAWYQQCIDPITGYRFVINGHHTYPSDDDAGETNDSISSRYQIQLVHYYQPQGLGLDLKKINNICSNSIFHVSFLGVRTRIPKFDESVFEMIPPWDQTIDGRTVINFKVKDWSRSGPFEITVETKDGTKSPQSLTYMVNVIPTRTFYYARRKGVENGVVRGMAIGFNEKYREVPDIMIGLPVMWDPDGFIVTVPSNFANRIPENYPHIDPMTRTEVLNQDQLDLILKDAQVMGDLPPDRPLDGASKTVRRLEVLQ